MRASFVEIYNETLRDLLSNGTDQLKHEIKMDPSNAGEVYLTNLTPTTVTSRDQVRRGSGHMTFVAVRMAGLMCFSCWMC